MTIRIGLIGTGVWARKVHCPALVAHPAIDFVGVWGRSPDARNAIAADFGVQPFDDVDALIMEVDAVVVAVAPDVQVALATRAAKAGRHLLLEKPVTADPREARALAHLTAAHGVAAVVFLARLFDREIAEWFTARRSENWTEAHVLWNSSSFTAGSEFAGGWRARSGAMVDVGPHVLAALELSLGPINDLTVTAHSAAGISFTATHATGAVSRAAIRMDADVARTKERYLFVAGDSSIDAPDWSIDYVAACGGALDELLRRIARTATPSPAMDLCTVEAAVGTATLLDSARTGARLLGAL